MAESEEELKNLLMRVKEENESIGLKLNIQKMKIMASYPITSWEIDGETVETVSNFILGGSKIIADGDRNHEIKKLAPCNPRDSQESSPTPQFKRINSSAISLLHSPTLTSIHDHRKNHSS